MTHVFKQKLSKKLNKQENYLAELTVSAFIRIYCFNWNAPAVLIQLCLSMYFQTIDVDINLCKQYLRKQFEIGCYNGNPKLLYNVSHIWKNNRWQLYEPRTYGIARALKHCLEIMNTIPKNECISSPLFKLIASVYVDTYYIDIDEERIEVIITLMKEMVALNTRLHQLSWNSPITEQQFVSNVTNNWYVNVEDYHDGADIRALYRYIKREPLLPKKRATRFK